MRTSFPIPEESFWILSNSQLEVFEDFMRSSKKLIEYLREEAAMVVKQIN